MTNIRSISHSDLIREAKRRGMEVRHKPVEISPEEDRAIRLLVLAAELYQEGIGAYAADILYAARLEAATAQAWLSRFIMGCIAFINTDWIDSGMVRREDD